MTVTPPRLVMLPRRPGAVLIPNLLLKSKAAEAEEGVCGVDLEAGDAGVDTDEEHEGEKKSSVSGS